MALTPEQRRLRARLAAQERWSRPGARAKQSRTIKDTRLAHYEHQVDPEGVLDPQERQACARAAASAHMTRLRLAKSRDAS